MADEPSAFAPYWKAREMLAHEYRIRGRKRYADRVMAEKAGFAAVCAIIKALEGK